MGNLRNTLILGAAIGIGVVGACGGNSGTNASSFPGNDGSMSDVSSGSGSGSGDGSGSSSGGFGSSSGGSSGAGSDATTDADFPCDGCAPFPPSGAPTCTPQVLGPPTLVYPPDGVLLPPNMNVLEVQWVPPTGATLFEVDFSNGITDVKVETPCNPITTVRGVANVGCGLTLPQQAWNDIANTNRDGAPVKVTVRATPASLKCVTASPQTVSVAFAKDDLAGGIYYWQSATYGGTAGKTGGIYSHDFGTFDPAPTPFYTSGGQGTCVGCHTLSRDGVRMSLMTDDPDADDEYGDVTTHTMDVASRTVIGGKNVGPGFQTFSHDHALMIASMFKMGANKSFGIWNGDGTTQLGTDALPTTPAQLYGTQPNLSADDKTLVFVAPGAVGGTSTVSMAGDHHFLGGSLWWASFDTTTYAMTNYTAFLTATGQQNFYYPDQAPSGNWVVFNENDDNTAANNDGDCFYSRQARVKIMHFPPQAGDQPLDLAALNVANGLSNSWPRWSPAPTSYHGKSVLWVTFSSNRDYGLHLKNTINGYPAGSPDGGTSGYDNYYPPESPAYDQPQPISKMNVMFNDYAAPQIWMAAIVIDPNRALDSTDRSFPAFWLPFQDVTAHNHSAQWVSKVQGPPGSDGGTGSSSGGAGDGAPMCNEFAGSCGPGGGTCCSDVVCCPGTPYSCQYGCAQ